METCKTSHVHTSFLGMRAHAMALLQLTPSAHTLQVTVADALDNPNMVKAAAEMLARNATGISMEGVKPLHKVRASNATTQIACISIMTPAHTAVCACTTETPSHHTAPAHPPCGAAQSSESV